MKFTIQKIVFGEELIRCIKSQFHRTTVPILTGIKNCLHQMMAYPLQGSDSDISY